MQLFFARLNVLIQLLLGLRRNERFKITRDSFLNCDWNVLFHVVLDQLVVVRVVLVLLRETFQSFFTALLCSGQIFHPSQFQALFVNLFLHQEAPLFKICNLFFLDLAGRKNFAYFFVKLYVLGLSANHTSSQSVNVFEHQLVYVLYFTHELVIPLFHLQALLLHIG